MVIMVLTTKFAVAIDSEIAEEVFVSNANRFWWMENYLTGTDVSGVLESSVVGPNTIHYFHY